MAGIGQEQPVATTKTLSFERLLPISSSLIWKQSGLTVSKGAETIQFKAMMGYQTLRRLACAVVALSMLWSNSAFSAEASWNHEKWENIGYVFNASYKLYVDIGIPLVKKDGNLEVLLVRARTGPASSSGFKGLLFIDCVNAYQSWLYGPIASYAEGESINKRANKMIIQARNAKSLTLAEQNLLRINRLSPITRGTLPALVYRNQCG